MPFTTEDNLLTLDAGLAHFIVTLGDVSEILLALPLAIFDPVDSFGL